VHGDGENERRAAGELERPLLRSLAARPLTDETGPTPPLKRAGQDLGAVGRALSDEHDERHREIRRLGVRPPNLALFAAVAEDCHDLAGVEEEIGERRGGLERSAPGPAKVEDQPGEWAARLGLEPLDRARDLCRGRGPEQSERDRADPDRAIDEHRADRRARALGGALRLRRSPLFGREHRRPRIERRERAFQRFDLDHSNVLRRRLLLDERQHLLEPRGEREQVRHVGRRDLERSIADPQAVALAAHLCDSDLFVRPPDPLHRLGRHPAGLDPRPVRVADHHLRERPRRPLAELGGLLSARAIRQAAPIVRSGRAELGARGAPEPCPHREHLLLLDPDPARETLVARARLEHLGADRQREHPRRSPDPLAVHEDFGLDRGAALVLGRNGDRADAHLRRDVDGLVGAAIDHDRLALRGVASIGDDDLVSSGRDLSGHDRSLADRIAVERHREARGRSRDVDRREIRLELPGDEGALAQDHAFAPPPIALAYHRHLVRARAHRLRAAVPSVLAQEVSVDHHDRARRIGGEAGDHLLLSSRRPAGGLSDAPLVDRRARRLHLGAKTLDEARDRFRDRGRRPPWIPPNDRGRDQATAVGRK
jgi:hypothetical protein